MTSQPADTVVHQDLAFALSYNTTTTNTLSEENNVDPSELPCKSALPVTTLGGVHNNPRDSNDGVAPKVTPAAATTAAATDTAGSQWSAARPAADAAAGAAADNDAAQEEPYATSKAKSDMDYAIQWLNDNPPIKERVLAVMRQYDASFYQRTSTSNVPFWREVLCDLVGKAGRVETTQQQQENPTTNPLPTTTTTTTPPEDDYCEDDSFFVIDLARIVVQYAKFKRHFPRLQPHYAVKCNNSIPIIAMISALGGSYDCASKGEFNTILDGGYQTAENIIFAHPCKMANNLIAAARRGVLMTTFDNEDELAKIQRLLPKAHAVLRIATDDRAALCEFSTKFGCPPQEAPQLLERAKELGVHVCGVSFHVGSGNSSFEAYDRAIHDARNIFDVAATLGFEMDLLDIGGGFPGSDPDPDPVTGRRVLFEDTANFIRPLLDRLFPPSSGVRLIAEPGRYFAESPYVICMQIHSKRRVQKRDGSDEYQYYTSDGKYQSFNCMLYDHAHPKIEVLRRDHESKIRNSTIFGPTCDGIDWIMKQQPFPALDIGDWVFVPDFGAYTVAAGSAFNGFLTRRVEFITSLMI